MIIGFDGSRAFVEGRTGTENYSYQLLKALAKLDQNNKYIVYTRPTVYGSFPRNFLFKEINWPRLWTQVGLALQTFQDKLDVVFVPAHTLPLIRKSGLKTVVTVHDLGSEYLPSMHQLKQRLYLGLTQKFQLKTATKIIAVSKATKDDLIKRIGISPNKISVVYEGFDKDLFKPAKDDQIMKKYNLKYHNYFLFVGTVQPRKNLARLIQAFAKFRDMYQVSSIKGKNKKPLIHNTNPLSLVIVGSKGWMSDGIYGLPKKLGIEDRVKFLGYVPEKDLPALYSGAIALTFPSLYEGFGLPILEAQACGCPVLTSNISSMPEVAGKGVVYVDPVDVDDIVRGMREIVRAYGNTPVPRVVKAGFENIKRFSWEKCARETLEVLEKV